MKVAGIVRRVDNLGRIVIPKELRNTMGIEEGDPMEIYLDNDGEIILKKYDVLKEASERIGKTIEYISENQDLPVGNRVEILKLLKEAHKLSEGKE